MVLRFKINTLQEAKALIEASDTLFLDVWESTDEWIDIRMGKDVVPLLLGILPASLHRAHRPLMHDLAQTIFESYPSGAVEQEHSHHRAFTPSLRHPSTDEDGGRELFFKQYQPLSVIYPWMRLMSSLFPTHVQMINIGTSYEGRDIHALQLGVRPSNRDDVSEPRKTILVSGGSHAREWISTSTVNYIAYSLIIRFGKSQGITRLLEQFDLVFIPTLNPDGYVYTWHTDRLWRKNRQQTALRFCKGVDLDRAFDFEWDGEASRTNPCGKTYAGDGPFDGVEARRLAEWARNATEHNNVTFVAYLDLHSYSQQILYPYSYSCSAVPPSLEDLEEVAMGLSKAIRLTNNQFYSVSSACQGSTAPSIPGGNEMRPKQEQMGGSALDWFYHEMAVKFAYQIKLRDTGSYGFLLPQRHILPTGKESYNAILALARFLMGNKGIEAEDFFVSAQQKGTAGQPEDSQAVHGNGEDATGSDQAPPHVEDEDEFEEDHNLELKRRRRKR